MNYRRQAAEPAVFAWKRKQQEAPSKLRRYFFLQTCQNLFKVTNGVNIVCYNKNIDDEEKSAAKKKEGGRKLRGRSKRKQGKKGRSKGAVLAKKRERRTETDCDKGKNEREEGRSKGVSFLV